MTWVIAHRGASAHEVENSLAAFRAAAQLGVNGVELDVHGTKDGTLVVHHDSSAGSFRIAETRFGELRDHQLPNGETIPRLSDALSTLGTDVEVFVEVKDLRAEHDDSLFAVLEAGPAPARYHVHSFDHRIIRRLKVNRPSLPCGVLSTAYPVEPLAQMRDARATELWQVKDMIDKQLVEAVHAADYRVYTWTVDEPQNMREFVALGVDAICTNRPDVAREVIG
ncbi:MAG: glycerophosphodiester phosphodiesterase [Gemmatimonadales bacterium]